MTFISDISKAAEKLKEQDTQLSIIFHPVKQESEFSESLSEVANTLFQNSGNIVKLSHGKGEGVPAVPALTFQYKGSGIINYMALPEGRDSAPFIEIITRDIKDQDKIETDLAKINRPADIKVFMASTCPNCPRAVRAANTLALLNNNITTSIIDVQHFPDLTEQFKIKSVPMTIIDNQLLINEVIPVEALMQHLLEQDSEKYLQDVFVSQAKTGNIERATERILKDNKNTNYFLYAWKNSTLSSRLGLMLIAEEVLEQNQSALDNIVKEFITVLKTDDVSLKGDTADLLGQIGHEDARKPLEALLNDDNEDIVDIAEEALENLDREN